jgi:hypothetical protein
MPDDADPDGYHPDHRRMADRELLGPPPAAFSALHLFVCTYVADLGGLHAKHRDITPIILASMRHPLVAVNSNYGHRAAPGYEYLIKAPKRATDKYGGRARAREGDGTCFHSAIEPVLLLPGSPAGKVYKIKCFTSTGKTQVPGVIRPDLSDGHEVLVAFVDFLNGLGVGDEYGEPDAQGVRPRRRVTLDSEQHNMLNYKFRMCRQSPRIIVDLHALAAYMRALESAGADRDTQLTEQQVACFALWPRIVLPPYRVRETKPPIDDVKVSFHFQGASRAPRINVFQKGKVNILGAETAQFAENIYAFFTALFLENWSVLVCLQPRSDSELSPAKPAASATGHVAPAARTAVARMPAPVAAPAAAAPAAAPAAVPMAAADLDAGLCHLFEQMAAELGR